MKYNKATIIYQKNGIKTKICKIIYHKDGSYFITSPYHKMKKANVFKINIDYEKEEQEISFDNLIDIHDLDDDLETLQLSHHPDGYLQFSGHNIKSGKNDDGSSKGVGIESWPLHSPPKGPAFTITIKNLNDFIKTKNIKNSDLKFLSEEIVDGNIYDDIILEGYYIPNNLKSYIYYLNGEEYFSLTHPTGLIINLKVIRPKENVENYGFLGFRIESYKLDFGEIESGFILNSSSGNIDVKEGKLISASTIHAFYPKILKNQIKGSLNWNKQSNDRQQRFHKQRAAFQRK